MKKKLYCLLFILYIPVLIVILSINGVFTGHITSLVNLLINVGFLLVIGAMFILSAFAFSRLQKFTDDLEKAGNIMEKEYETVKRCLWPEYRERKNVFSNAALNEAFEEYQKRMASGRTKRGQNVVCDLEDYINTELLDRVAMAHYNSAVSGTLTGLGILGTFLGLSIGLGSFNGDDIYTISDNVGPLLEGMKVAFHTSVYGIFFSLVFNFVYRSIMAEAYGTLESFLIKYHQYTAPAESDQDETSRAMLIYQANMSSSMKHVAELLEGKAMEQTKEMEQIAQQFVYLMSQSIGIELGKLGKSLNDTAAAYEQGSKAYASMEKASEEFLEVNRSIQKQLEQLLKRQEELAARIDKQEEKLSRTCRELDEELSSQLYTFNQMRDIYEK